MTSAIQKRILFFAVLAFLVITLLAATPSQPVLASNHDVNTSSNSGDCSSSLDPEDCGITSYIVIFTDALSVLVGIVVVMMLVVGGIRYASASNNPQAVASAKQHISNALLALVLYLFMFAFLQWIVPGGIL